MTDTKEQPETVVIDDETDGHSAMIPVEHFHFNVIAIAQEAAKRFTTKTGKEAKYLYAPEALLYMLDQSVKTRARNGGSPLPRGTIVAQIAGMELIVVPGTCITVTHEPLHTVGSVPPTIVMPAPEGIQ